MTADESAGKAMDAAALLPCPICGSTDIDPEGTAYCHNELTDSIEHAPTCRVCDCSAPDWNKRHHPIRNDLVERLKREKAELIRIVKEALQFKGAWREAIVELEDHCSEPVRLRNMLAAADQLDHWSKSATKLLTATQQDEGKGS